MKRITLQRIHGQRSFILETDSVRLAVTELGGHMAPVQFFRNSDAPFEPYAVAPWAEEKTIQGLPNMLKALRGDFFCLPFGGNEKTCRGERHPPHGETANAVWRLKADLRSPWGAVLSLALRTSIRRGMVRKRLVLPEGENTVYSSHVISEMNGPMCLGHHATLRFPDAPGSGLVSLSPFRFGQVYPGEFESPENKGYSILKAGAEFTDLSRVKRLDGRYADLTRYPARRGFEDLVMVCSERGIFPAWAAVVFPKEKTLWFALKDPRVLASTILWHDNGGRHYPPWSGRGVNTLGIEDVTAHFHDGLAQSAGRNPLKKRAIPTEVRLSPSRPFPVYYIQGMARTPRGFGRVREIKLLDDESVRIIDERGRAFRHPVRWTFLLTGQVDIAELDNQER